MYKPINCIAFFSLLLLASCQVGQKRDQIEIGRLERSLGPSPEGEKAAALVDRYEQYANNYPQDDETNSKYLYRGAALAYRMNRFSHAIELAEKAIREDYAGSNTPNNALLLAALYREKLRNDALTQTVYQAAGRAFPNNGQITKKVDENWGDLDSRLKNMQKQIFDTTGEHIDYRMANDFISSASIYAMLLPGEERSAEWIFAAAESAHSIRAFSKSLELYAWIVERFPKSKQAGEALFLQAFTLDNDLSRFEEAGALYRSFLEKYPGSEFADDAKFLLENLGKDEGEIIRSFEKNRAVQ